MTHPEVLVWCVAAAVLYALGVRRVAAQRTRAWPLRRSAAFTAGLAVTLFALVSPYALRADDALSDHMVQHLLLMLVAAPLLVLGAPLSLALQALPRAPRAQLAGAIRSRPVRALTHPLSTWTLFAAATVATHLTGFYDLALRSPLVHGLEHAIYLGTALLFWLPVVGANPVRQLHSWVARTAYLVLAMPPMSAVSAALVYAPATRYAAYGDSAAALRDQQDAGAYMWVFGSIVMVAAAVAIGWEALVREERRQRVLDALEGSA